MHKQFAEIYDIFMKYVDYDGWYNFLKGFIKTKGTILDLGCGTGEFILRFLEDGFSVVGVDLSEKMLEVAEKKLNDPKIIGEKFSKDRCRLIKENIINFENTVDFENNKNNNLCQVDYIVCNFDTVNYLKNEKEFLKFIEKCNKNLKKDGFLIFDAVTEDIFEEILEEAKTIKQFSEKLQFESETDKEKFISDTEEKLENGFCIRCKKEIAFNSSRPLCNLCYRTWKDFSNEEYPEHYCHKCGKEFENISFKHCFCNDCNAHGEA